MQTECRCNTQHEEPNLHTDNRECRKAMGKAFTWETGKDNGEEILTHSKYESVTQYILFLKRVAVFVNNVQKAECLPWIRGFLEGTHRMTGSSQKRLWCSSQTTKAFSTCTLCEAVSFTATFNSYHIVQVLRRHEVLLPSLYSSSCPSAFKSSVPLFLSGQDLLVLIFHSISRALILHSFSIGYIWMFKINQYYLHQYKLYNYS